MEKEKEHSKLDVERLKEAFCSDVKLREKWGAIDERYYQGGFDDFCNNQLQFPESPMHQEKELRRLSGVTGKELEMLIESIRDKQIEKKSENIFRLAGGMWEVRYKNGEMFYYPKGNGFEHIHFLLGCKLHQWQGVMNVSTQAGKERVLAGYKVGEPDTKIDREGLGNILKRIIEIRENPTPENEVELVELQTYLNSDTYGKGVKAFKNGLTRRAESIRKNIDRARDKIKKDGDIDLFRHLKRSIQQDKCDFSYAPESETTWNLS